MDTSDVTQTFLSAARTVSRLVDDISETAWSSPGLGVWTLRDLVGHTSRSLVTVLTYLDAPAERVDIATPQAYYAAIRKASSLADSSAADAVAERGRAAGRALGVDPAAAFRRLRAEVEQRLRGVDFDTAITTIAGGMTVAAYLPTRTFELVVHGIDIAAALGTTADFDRAVLREAAALAAAIAVELGDGPALLAGLTGREALADGFSVV